MTGGVLRNAQPISAVRREELGNVQMGILGQNDRVKIGWELGKNANCGLVEIDRHHTLRLSGIGMYVV